MSQPPTEPCRIAIAGATGRMGQAIAEVIEGGSDAVVTGRIGRQLGPSLVSADEAMDGAEVIIDVSTPAAAAHLAAQCASRGHPALVIGATGFDADQEAAITAASRRIAIVKSGNFSLGMNLLAALVRRSAQLLGPAYDIEIFEAHHRRKADAPSGSALMLGRAAAAGRGADLDTVSERARDGITGPRADGAIGFSVMRGGGIVGEHSVTFAAEDEIITLAHSARDRRLFARGAVAAALWVRGKPPGLYGMDDVLGLKD